MLGLRTQESDKFNKFFELIQQEAKKVNCVFFADAGDGNDFEDQSMEGEDMMGWLVPNDRVNEFEPLWKEDKVDNNWTDLFKWAIWSKNNGNLQISFKD